MISQERQLLHCFVAKFRTIAVPGLACMREKVLLCLGIPLLLLLQSIDFLGDLYKYVSCEDATVT